MPLQKIRRSPADHSLRRRFDPSGLYMSEVDLPARFAKYNGNHIKLKRIALTTQTTDGTAVVPGNG